MACRRLCICFTVCFVIAASPFAILITLASVGLEPRFYIQEFYVPAINNSIFIDLKFKRVSAFVPLLFGDLNITLFKASNRSFSVGSYVVPGFYQGDKKAVHRKVVVEAFHDQKVSGSSTAVFTLELATKYMLKRCNGGDHCYYSTPKAVVVAADVRVDSSGEKVARKPIRLR